jgi:hypothetical protein
MKSLNPTTTLWKFDILASTPLLAAGSLELKKIATHTGWYSITRTVPIKTAVIAQQPSVTPKEHLVYLRPFR